MANVLFLVHRMPYPPNKGDKVRSYHLLQHLAEQHRVFVGTFIDDPEDEVHVPALRRMCTGLHAERLHTRRARIGSLLGLATGEALTLHYYRSASLQRWVAETVRREAIDLIVVFSSSMAQYATPHPQLPMLLDLVDVDSAKWSDYAPNHRWPMSWLYAREGRELLAYERQVAQQARQCFFATDKEAELFCSLAPEARATVEGMNNGVDAQYFSPEARRASPFQPGETALVFTGAMDYWPNIDAVTWCVQSMLPALRQKHPKLRLYIVGRSPTAAVKALAGEAVSVTGTVPDVRPYLQHAAVVVAPLRLARGIQNKILEAMAMERPVVASAACVDAMQVEPGADILPASEAEDFVRTIDGLLRSPDRASAIGLAGRRRVVDGYSWRAHLRRLDRHVAACLQAAAPAPAQHPATNPATNPPTQQAMKGLS